MDLQQKNKQLKQQTKDQATQIKDLLQQLRSANQKIKDLVRKQFTPTSERISAEQLTFFEPESCFSDGKNPIEDTFSEIVMVPVQKKKHRKREDSLSADLPVEIVINKLSEPTCGTDPMHLTTTIGTKYVRTEVQYIRAHVKLIKYYQETYQCLTCSKLKGKSVFFFQDMARALFAHSYATPSLVAHVLHLKYELGVPLYRQLKDWHRLGIGVQEPTLANWVINAAQLLESLLKRMKQILFYFLNHIFKEMKHR